MNSAEAASNHTIDQVLQRAIAHHLAGRLAEAEDGYRRVLAIDRDHFHATHNLGLIAYSVGRHVIALDWIQRAIQINPSSAGAYSNLALVLKAMGYRDKAAEAFDRSLAIDPANAATHNNLGNLYFELQRFPQAVEASRRAIRLNPGYAEAHSNLGSALAELGQLNEAIEEHRKAIALKPQLAEAHWNLSLVLLLLGDLTGWTEYEWRWMCKGFSSPRRNFTQPQWTGQSLHGKTILIHTEQGFGDNIQFVRYTGRVTELGGRVIVECPPELRRLFQEMPGTAEVIDAGTPLPAFDLHCPMLSLPLMCGAALDAIPGPVPYLRANPTRAEIWKSKLGTWNGELRVGLAWAGSPTQRDDRKRSITLNHLAPLAGIPGVRFFSLQKGPPARQLAQPPPGLDVIDLTDQITDFADTAALIENLDLVISVCTSIAHLTGAMGKPVWTMLCWIPDWRWLLDREDSPYYPTMRLFRQRSIGDWNDVLSRVRAALVSRSAEHADHLQLHVLPLTADQD